MKFRIVEVVGPASAEFLHRVTAGTVKGLPKERGLGGLFLNGQSRMIAQFDLLHLVFGHYYLAAPEPCAADLAAGLEALHFAEELEISLTDKVADVAASSQFRLGREPFLVEWKGENLTWPSAVAGFAMVTGGTSCAPWDYERIGALVPWPQLDWDKNTPALEAGVLPWIDRLKGCYPGQEVVELSLNVGHPGRVLVAVESPRLFEHGEKIPWDNLEATVTSSAQRDGKFRALIRVPWAKRDFIPPGFVKLRSHW